MRHFPNVNIAISGAPKTQPDYRMKSWLIVLRNVDNAHIYKTKASFFNCYVLIQYITEPRRENICFNNIENGVIDER